MNGPMESRFDRITVPVVTGDGGSGDLVPNAPNSRPVSLVVAKDNWLRVLVRNNSPNGGSMFLAYDDAPTLAKAIPGSNCFELPAGSSEVFVLAPRQKLYCSTTTEGTICSIAVSMALPLDLKA